MILGLIFCKYTMNHVFRLCSSKFCTLAKLSASASNKFQSAAFFHTSPFLNFEPNDPGAARRRKERKASKESSLSLIQSDKFFDEIPSESKNQEAFEHAISLFRTRNLQLRGHVDFIYIALKRMKEFNVHESLDVYKKLIDLFPRGKMVNKNSMQVGFEFYPKHQECCRFLLDQMSFYGVHADKETYKMVEAVFGNMSITMKKMKYQMYWMPKLKHSNPYPVPKPLPNSDIELAKIIINRICRDAGNITTLFFSESLPDAKEDTWIVSGQSPLQMDHIKEHALTEPLYIDGPFRVWAGKRYLYYFMLAAEPNSKKHYADVKPDNYDLPTPEEWLSWDNKYSTEFPESRRKLMLAPTIHEQPDGTILALVITGSGSKESLSYWLTFLQKDNPRLGQIPVIFRMASSTSSGDLVPVEGAQRIRATTNMLEL